MPGCPQERIFLERVGFLVEEFKVRLRGTQPACASRAGRLPPLGSHPQSAARSAAAPAAPAESDASGPQLEAVDPQVERWYWAVVELTRKLMLTAVLSLVTPGSTLQARQGLPPRQGPAHTERCLTWADGVWGRATIVCFSIQDAPGSAFRVRQDQHPGCGPGRGR